MVDLSRRDFLNVVRSALLYLTGGLAAGGLVRFLAADTHPAPQTEFDIGPAADYPMGSRTVIPEVPALLAHTAAGFSAVSLTCTHLGCSLKESPEGFACVCHGSRFDANGGVAHGPAKDALQPLRVEVVADGRLRLIKSS